MKYLKRLCALACACMMTVVSVGGYANAGSRYYKGQTVKVKSPYAASKYSSSDKTIAKVKKDGSVKFKGVGIVTITITDKKTGKTKSLKFNVKKCHHWYEKYKVIEPATCTEPGKAESICSVCKVHKKTKIIKPKGHSGEWTILEEANGCKSGSKIRTCEVCGEVEQVEIPGDPNAHKWSLMTTTQPTCTTEGTKIYRCELCGEEKIEKIPATGVHNWDKGTTTVTATCETTGVMTYTCKDCGLKKTESIPKTAHKWDKGTVTEAATCEHSGTKTFKCSVCGQTKKEDIEATGHNWKDSATIIAATCLTEGRKQQTCQNCKKTREVSSNKTEHNYKATTAQPTCTKAGTITYKCSICGDTYTTEFGEPTGHTWAKTTTMPATLTAMGYDLYTCSDCHETKRENEVYYNPSRITISGTLENGKAAVGTCTGKITVYSATGTSKTVDTYEGLEWLSTAYYMWNGGVLDGSVSGYGDLAFAMIISDGVWGINPARIGEIGDAEIGDMVKDANGHYAVIYKLDGNVATLAEADYEGSGLVSWSREVDLTQGEFVVVKRRQL